MEVDLERAVEVLERTPGALRALLAGLDETWVTASEGPGTFSPKDVLGHLIHGEETDWVPRIRVILEDGEKCPFTPFDRFGFRTKIEEQTLALLLDRFETLRRESLGYLRSLALDPARLERTGMHPELGRVTLGELIATWVVHDLGHTSQILRVMAREYDVAVGPWKAYLSILKPA